MLRKKVVNGNATNHFQKLVEKEKEKEKEQGHEHDMIWGIVGGFWIRLVLLCYYAYLSHTLTLTLTRYHLLLCLTFHLKLSKIKIIPPPSHSFTLMSIESNIKQKGY